MPTGRKEMKMLTLTNRCDLSTDAPTSCILLLALMWLYDCKSSYVTRMTTLFEGGDGWRNWLWWPGDCNVFNKTMKFKFHSYLFRILLSSRSQVPVQMQAEQLVVSPRRRTTKGKKWMKGSWKELYPWLWATMPIFPDVCRRNNRDGFWISVKLPDRTKINCCIILYFWLFMMRNKESCVKHTWPGDHSDLESTQATAEKSKSFLPPNYL